MSKRPATFTTSPSKKSKGRIIDAANGEEYTATTKAYKNHDFLMSKGARSIRILCELEETAQRLQKNGVTDTVLRIACTVPGPLATAFTCVGPPSTVPLAPHPRITLIVAREVLFFASARSKSKEKFAIALEKAKSEVAAASDEEQKAKAVASLERLEKVVAAFQGPPPVVRPDKMGVIWQGKWVTEYYERIQELAKRISAWSVSRAKGGKREYAISTGGGPGMMEAANAGAASVEGAKSIGMGISLPFEAGLNPSVMPELGFEFHYFFTRKFFMIETMRALVVAPGGMGTCDELFEVLTLMQTGKRPVVPIVLFGKEYWKTIVNWQAMCDFGTISQSDVDRLFFTDDVDEAFEHISKALEAKEAEAEAVAPLSPFNSARDGIGKKVPGLTI